MGKDDYIRFRCSSELKQLADNNAKEKGLSLTDYMEYLIRKDKDNMIYVFSTDDLEKNEFRLVEKVVENGLAVKMGDVNEHLLSKTDKLIVDGRIVLESDTTLEQFISWFDDGDDISFIRGLKITKSDVINTFINAIDQSYNNEKTYAEAIYDAENPKEQIDIFLNMFLIIHIDNMISEINIRKEQIITQQENGQLIVKWD